MKIDLSSLNLIEKFIVEHGSAAVMGIHINLLREQLSAFERETANLKAEVTQLKDANKALTAQLQQRAAETHRLQVAAEQQRTARRTETDEKILLTLTGRQKRTASEIAGMLGIGHDRAEVYLSELRKADLVCVQAYAQYAGEPHQESDWSLSNEGRKYLADWQLVK